MKNRPLTPGEANNVTPPAPAANYQSPLLRPSPFVQPPAPPASPETITVQEATNRLAACLRIRGNLAFELAKSISPTVRVKREIQGRIVMIDEIPIERFEAMATEYARLAAEKAVI